MQPQTETDYRKLLTECDSKTNDHFRALDYSGKSQKRQGIDRCGRRDGHRDPGQPQELIEGLIDQFVQLSGLIVKKTMEPSVCLPILTA